MDLLREEWRPRREFGPGRASYSSNASLAAKRSDRGGALAANSARGGPPTAQTHPHGQA